MPQIGKRTSPKPAEIAELLRRRVLAGLRSGVLARGDRLPSTRDLATQIGADPRAILVAYRELVDDGLVEMRPRSGIYVADRPSASHVAPGLAEGWLVDLFAEGIGRDIPAPDLPEWMRRSIDTLRLHAVVVAPTGDQRVGLCRELRADYGLDSTAFAPGAIVPDGERPPPEIRRADIILCTRDQAAVIQPLGNALGKPVITLSVRPDLVSMEWMILLQQPTYVVAVDRKFVELLRAFFRELPGVENLRAIVAGVDDVSGIPDEAPTYVTRAARERLGDMPIPGRIIPTARFLSPQSAREVLSAVISANLAVLGARGPVNASDRTYPRPANPRVRTP